MTFQAQTLPRPVRLEHTLTTLGWIPAYSAWPNTSVMLGKLPEFVLKVATFKICNYFTENHTQLMEKCTL